MDAIEPTLSSSGTAGPGASGQGAARPEAFQAALRLAESHKPAPAPAGKTAPPRRAIPNAAAAASTPVQPGAAPVPGSLALVSSVGGPPSGAVAAAASAPDPRVTDAAGAAAPAGRKAPSDRTPVAVELPLQGASSRLDSVPPPEAAPPSPDAALAFESPPSEVRPTGPDGTVSVAFPAPDAVLQGAVLTLTPDGLVAVSLEASGPDRELAADLPQLRRRLEARGLSLGEVRLTDRSARAERALRA